MWLKLIFQPIFYQRKGIFEMSFRCSGSHCKRVFKWTGMQFASKVCPDPVLSQQALLQLQLKQLASPPGPHQVHPGQQRHLYLHWVL